jgi:hypothetical protein
MTIEKIKLLKKAFIWEKETFLQALIDKANTEVSDENLMTKELQLAWIKYFQKMGKSNDTVVSICTDATEVPPGGTHPPLDEETAKNEIKTYIADSDYADVRGAIEAFLD